MSYQVYITAPGKRPTVTVLITGSVVYATLIKTTIIIIIISSIIVIFVHITISLLIFSFCSFINSFCILLSAIVCSCVFSFVYS